MARPMELAVRLSWYVMKNKAARRNKFPLVTILEPLEACNLACEGCGRIREYEAVIDRMLTVDQCMQAVEDSGAPIVSIAGGEPSMHPKIGEIVERIIATKRFVYMCTNGLLMERVMKSIPPSKYFCFVVHMDGMEEAHDTSVYRKGVFQVATRAMRAAIERGYRVSSNTTIFNGVDEDDMIEMFKMLTDVAGPGTCSPASSTKSTASSSATTRCISISCVVSESTRAPPGRRPPTPFPAGGSPATCWATDTRSISMT